MTSIRKILVPTNLSEAGTAALLEAQRFAEGFGATIDLLHVWSPPALMAPEAVVTGTGVNEQPLLEWMRQTAEEHLLTFRDEARARGIHVDGALCELGDPAAAIVERAAAGHYDLLVLASRERGALARALLGSVTEQVIRHAPCPVLTVHPQA